MTESARRLAGRETLAANPADALLEAQKHVLEMIIHGRPLTDVLDALCRIVEAQADRPVRAAILLVDPSGKRLVRGAAPSLPDAYMRAIDGIAIDPNVGTCCAAVARREAIVTSDIASAPGWKGLAHLPLELGLKAAWSMPIISSAGVALGTFGTYFPEPREPLASERRLVEVLTRTAALAIERQRTDLALHGSARRHRFLAELSHATQPIAEPEALLTTTARMLADYLEVDRCAYAEIEDERVFVITGDHSRGVPSIVGRWDVAAFGPACEEAMRTGHAFVVHDTDADAQVPADFLPAYRATNIRAVICVPLHKDGRFTAAMAVHQATPRHWTHDEIELVAIVVSRCWEALERARVSRTLRESEARYRAIVEATPECVKLVAADGTLLHMNAAGLRMVEANAEEEVAGRCIYDVIAPWDRKRFRAFNERVCSGEDGTLEFEIIGRSGTRRSMETTAVALPAPTGGFMQLAITRDITARVSAARALAESRARLDYAVRLSGVGFWYCDLPFDELVWDERVKEHFFLPPDARVTIDDFYARIHPEDREPTRAAIDASIHDRVSYDVVYRTVDPEGGAIKWIRALGGTAYGDDGQPEHFDGVTVDVTAEKLVQARLAALNDQLREQDRRKDEFLATLAHELRNPLAPIRTGLHILQTGAGGEQAERVREMMERQLAHLVRMVDDLLDISRITLGKVALRRERVDFRSVLHSALETTRPLIEAGRHELAVRLPNEAFPLDADATRLAQVIANLVNNSAKYTPAGGRIQLTAEAEAGWLVVRVTDNGIGIPAEMLPRVFDIFTQVGRSVEHSQGGLGIGLTLVRRLVEMHGGTVVAESSGVGKGTTFTVRLPLAAAKSAGASNGEREEASSAAEPLRILIVDDNVDAAATLAMLLDLSGHETRLAHTGGEALACVQEFAPQVVFLDIGLPGMSGYEVARRLRANEAIVQPVLVAVTGWGSDDDRRQAHEAGFDQHLVKPVGMEELRAALHAGRPRAAHNGALGGHAGAPSRPPATHPGTGAQV